jgi:hypothetical protein
MRRASWEAAKGSFAKLETAREVLSLIRNGRDFRFLKLLAQRDAFLW